MQSKLHSFNVLGAVLLVEDDPSQRQLTRFTLEREGVTVQEADNGRKALEVMETHPEIRMVITDLTMPDMDGFDLIHAIRENELRYTYVIVLTAADDHQSVIKALELGADDFVTKPVLPDELHLRLRSGQRLLRLESQEELIFSLAKLAEYRSNETGFHLERTSYYSRILARDLGEHCPELGITSQLAEEIARVSPLHDIGKVAIPDAILHKPGRLTAEEFEVIKTHPAMGGKLLQDIHAKTGSLYLQVAAEIAMYHHERWDGRGYPEGLAGDAIPISARIMALADVYDALTSERSYKQAYPHERAREIIVEGSGSHFDPRVVAAFLRQEDIWLVVRKRFLDERKAGRP